MTKTEVKDILVGRLDFRVDSPVNASGRYFEGEHSIITLDNIKNSQPEVNISESDFSDYLSRLKDDVVYQVLSDVFDRDEIKDEIIDFYPSLFDNSIAMQMHIKVINIILASNRSSLAEKIGKGAINRIFFDLKGNKGSDKFPIADGIEHKYRSEIRRVKNKIGGQRKFLSITSI